MIAAVGNLLGIALSVGLPRGASSSTITDPSSGPGEGVAVTEGHR